MNADVHQRRGERRAAATRVVDCWASLFGERVARVPAGAGHHRRAGDRGRRAADGRLRAHRRDVHRRPRRPATATQIVDRGRVRSRRGRRRRPGRARHVHACARTARGCSACASAPESHKIVRGENGTETRRPHGGRGARRVCTDDDGRSTSRSSAPRSKRTTAQPQDIEWAIAAGRLYLVQSRPITTTVVPPPRRAARPPVRSLSAASAPRPGVVSGRGARAAAPSRRRRAADRRGARRADDEPGLGADVCGAPRRSSPTAAA